MIDECQAITLGREAQVADPAGGFIQYLADRVLYTTLAAADVDNGQRVAIRDPVGLFDVVQQVAGSICADGKLSHRADTREAIVADAKATQHRHLPVGRNRQDLGCRKS